MLSVAVLTLFPEMFAGVLGQSILKRAIADGQLSVELINFREFSKDKHKTVDDYPFGGGAGMLLKAEPLFDAVAAISKGAPSACGRCSEVASSDVPSSEVQCSCQDSRVVLMSPQGRPFSQRLAVEFSNARRLVFICGHYEGFDERIRQELVTDEVSLGDFVLTGGEIPAMAVIDAVARLLPGVLGNDVSAHDDSYSSGLLEHPQYTRPADFRGLQVPDTLLSGNHQRISQWRHLHSLYRTWVRRPDLLHHFPLTPADKAVIDRFERGDFSGIDVLEPIHRSKDIDHPVQP